MLDTSLSCPYRLDEKIAAPHATARTKMKNRHLYSIILPVIYIAASVFSLFNSEWGHAGPSGCVLLFVIIISFPLGIVPFGLAAVTGNETFIALFPVFGLVQYVSIGYSFGRWIDRRQARLQ